MTYSSFLIYFQSNNLLAQSAYCKLYHRHKSISFLWLLTITFFDFCSWEFPTPWDHTILKKNKIRKGHFATCYACCVLLFSPHEASPNIRSGAGVEIAIANKKECQRYRPAVGKNV